MGGTKIARPRIRHFCLAFEVVIAWLPLFLPRSPLRLALPGWDQVATAGLVVKSLSSTAPNLHPRPQMRGSKGRCRHRPLRSTGYSALVRRLSNGKSTDSLDSRCPSLTLQVSCLDTTNIFSFPPCTAHFLFDVSKRKWGKWAKRRQWRMKRARFEEAARLTAIQGSRCGPAERAHWEEEMQGSERSFRRKAKTKLSGLCNDVGRESYRRNGEAFRCRKAAQLSSPTRDRISLRPHQWARKRGAPPLRVHPSLWTNLHRRPEYRFCWRSFAAMARMAVSSPTMISSSRARVRAVYSTPRTIRD